MRKIKTIDDITKDGKVEFGEGYEFVDTAEEADAILMRSTDLHGYELPEGIRAIARCGAGVNNIPVEEYAKKGVVVLTPRRQQQRRQGARPGHAGALEPRRGAVDELGARQRRRPRDSGRCREGQEGLCGPRAQG